ncbi:hypothetical protein LOTGIDRAFT_205086 [Lottia gigantea]|uniref:Akirin n=1 Tax=Lottia gigantea TaxID=225164 RepID=V4B4Y4_LOTGI|nr:hypothetical protein LOTGIDRAFT_205086 [Lottia gigantea]ESP02551.1 hypothetical protein LOTGIDRAFT_205086 [Lottia gigantea]
MACGATLKRTSEFDSLHSPGQGSPKRRRYVMPIQSTTSPAKQAITKSLFADALPKLTTEQIATRITQELKRMQHRRQIHYHDANESSSSPQPSLDQSTNLNFDPTQISSPTKKDVAIFTFRQVSMICDRMIKDREEQIQVQYDNILTSKLAEQYESFLKFNHDQLQKRYGDAPMSYVS